MIDPNDVQRLEDQMTEIDRKADALLKKLKDIETLALHVDEKVAAALSKAEELADRLRKT